MAEIHHDESEESEEYEEPRRSERLEKMRELFLMFNHGPSMFTAVCNERPEIVAKGDTPVSLKLHKLTHAQTDLLNAIATLAMQDHLILYVHLAWRKWQVLKIEKAAWESAECEIGDGIVDGRLYHVTFEAGCKDVDYHITFEAQVWEAKSMRRVSRVRVIAPCTNEWVPGHLWIPLG